MARKSKSLKDRIAQRIARSDSAVFIPADFADLGGKTQVNRALRQLVAEQVAGKLGYGVYAKLIASPIDGSKMIPVAFDDAVREALGKLGVRYDETRAVKDYNAGLTTQVQANAVYVPLQRFSRKLTFDGMEAVFVKQ